MSPNEAARPVESAWRKASFCGSTECVEVARRGDVIMLRDSSQPNGDMLEYTVEEWRFFVRNVKAGEFDRISS
jgi:Domain of unknown function (DUF397)